LCENKMGLTQQRLNKSYKKVQHTEIFTGLKMRVVFSDGLSHKKRKITNHKKSDSKTRIGNTLFIRLGM